MPGYIVKVRANGKEYFYLRVSYRKNKKKKCRNIYSFGNKREAINILNRYIRDPENVPVRLRGYRTNDFQKWLSKINK